MITVLRDKIKAKGKQMINYFMFVCENYFTYQLILSVISLHVLGISLLFSFHPKAFAAGDLEQLVAKTQFEKMITERLNQVI